MTNSRRLAGPVILALSATLAACTPPATPPLDLAAIEGEVRAADEALVAAEATPPANRQPYPTPGVPPCTLVRPWPSG